LSWLVMFALTLMLIGCSLLETLERAAPEGSVPQNGLSNGTVVDGIRVGNAIDCNADPDCATRVTLAKAAVIERHRLASAALGAANFYMPYIPPGATRGGGGGAIVVFDLEDGSQAAVYTYCMDGCFVVPPQPVVPLTPENPVDHGPLVDPLVLAPRDCGSSDNPTCNEAVQLAIDTATANGFLVPDTIADAHYYVINVTPGTPEAAASRAEYIVDVYIAGAHDVLAETAIGVYCGSGPCHVVSP
jgi:hypothetical protein